MALATDASLDGVVIASPDATHADLAIAAMDTGLWVLCEKPLATTMADAWRVVDAESAIGSRRIQLGFMREYDPAHVQLVAELPELGRIDALRAVHRNSNDRRRPLAQIVGQSMVHDIHSARFISGEEITSVHAFGAGASDDSYRHVLAVCRLESGAHAVLEFDDAGFAYEVSVEVLGTDGDVLTGAPDAGGAAPQGLARHVHRSRLVRVVRRGLPRPGPGMGGVDRGRRRRSARRRGTGSIAQHVVEAIIRSLASGRVGRGRTADGAGDLLTVSAATAPDQRPATRTRYDVVMRASSISIHRFCHASSAVGPSADATETLPSYRSATAIQIGSIRSKPAVDAAHVVLAVVERGAPAGTLEITAFRRLQHRAVLSRTLRRTQKPSPHGQQCERSNLWIVSPRKRVN